MITIDESLKKLYPHISLGCVTYTTTVEDTNPSLWARLEAETYPAILALTNSTPVTELPNVATSRAAYKAFGKDPSRYRVSSEALYRRILQGKGLYKINTVVDTNNLISLETGFSVGSYDLANLHGNITLRLGAQGETYKGIGKEEIKVDNLPLLADADGAFGSPTSDSTRAMITATSKNIITIIYNFSENVATTNVLDLSSHFLETYARAKNIKTFWV